MTAARTVMTDDGRTLAIDSPSFEVVSIEAASTAASGGWCIACIDIPLHLVPDVLTALMKAARHASVDLPAGDRGGYLAARARSLA